MKSFLLVFYFLILSSNYLLACTGGTNAGALSPTAVYQTQSVLNGQYYTINVSQCNIYDFTFCSNGGSASYDTQISILDNTGVQIGYNDDFCSLQSSITYTATFTGTIRVLISKYSCNHDLTSSATLAYRVTPKTGNYCLNGSASYQTIGGQSCIQLTPEVNAQTGCAWNDQAINFNNPFNLSLNYYFGNNINGADGTTFTFQPNPSACGTSGGQLGAGGIPNSLVIEFDTYDNDNPTHLYDMLADHIAVEIDGNLQGPGAPYCGPVQALPGGLNLDDGNVHAISIQWDPVTQVLGIYVDGNLRLSCSGNFITTVFGGNSNIYWGATAATGGLNNQQYFCPNTVVVLPVELSDFSSSCNGDQEIVTWTSQNEVNLEKYILEYTNDGQLYYSLGEKVATNTNGSATQYHLTVDRNWEKQTYYRLTSVDNDGTLAYTDIISSRQCAHTNDNLIQLVQASDNGVKLRFSIENTEFQLFDATGKTITTVLQAGSSEQFELITTLSSGIYILKAWNSETNRYETARFFY